MSDHPADIWSKSYQQAASIKGIIDLVTPALLDGVAQLGAVIATLETTKEFGDDTRADIQEAVTEARQHHDRLSSRLEQVLADLDIILRSIGETSGLTRQARERIGIATGHLQEGGDLLGEHVNTAANVATLAGNRAYFMLDGDNLIKVLELVHPGKRDEALLRLDSATFKGWAEAVEKMAIYRESIGKDSDE